VIAVPGFVEGINGDVEQLMHKFGNCRRRAYVVKQWVMIRMQVHVRRLRLTFLVRAGWNRTSFNPTSYR